MLVQELFQAVASHTAVVDYLQQLMLADARQQLTNVQQHLTARQHQLAAKGVAHQHQFAAKDIAHRHQLAAKAVAHKQQIEAKDAVHQQQIAEKEQQVAALQAHVLDLERCLLGLKAGVAYVCRNNSKRGVAQQAAGSA